jgi:hypothetical protein
MQSDFPLDFPSVPMLHVLPQTAAAGPGSEGLSGEDLLTRARALAIPWERLLLEEIKAEEMLRRFLADVEVEWPLWSALRILPLSFLTSWRLRDRIRLLSCQARGIDRGGALRQLRLIFAFLSGKLATARSEAPIVEHLWFAHQRVLLLQRVSRAAARSRGATADRLAFVRAKTGCHFDDAVWAICREDAPGRGHRLDAAMRKAREEGFQIPRESTEAKAFRRLRSIARSAPARRRTRTRPRPIAIPDHSAVARPVRLPLVNG